MTKPLATKRKNGLILWALRILLVLAIVVIALCILGSIYQVIASEIDKRNFPPPGQLVDVDGYQLHLYCTGTGNPVVILDSASLDTVSGWYWVQAEIAKTTRVCAYDRPGLGWSDLGPEPRDAQQNAGQLHTLIHESGVNGPYILVGHSLGGLYVRVYAGQYPNEVAGLVLVEGTHPDFLARFGQPEVMPNADEGMLSAGPIAARLGLFRLITFVPTDPELPEQQQGELAAYYASTKFADRLLSVYRQFPNLLAQARSVRDFGELPLLIVIGSSSDNATGDLRVLQDELLTLSSESRQRVVAGASHVSLVHNQHHALETSVAILNLVETVRAGQ